MFVIMRVQSLIWSEAIVHLKKHIELITLIKYSLLTTIFEKTNKNNITFVLIPHNSTVVLYQEFNYKYIPVV